MKILFWLLPSALLALSATCSAEMVCLNGKCHNVVDMGGGYVSVDGEMHHINRNGSTTTIDNHTYQDFGGGFYSKDGRMHTHQDIGGGYFLQDGELNHIQRY